MRKSLLVLSREMVNESIRRNSFERTISTKEVTINLLNYFEEISRATPGNVSLISERVLGFSLLKRKSTIQFAGDGIYIKGRVMAGSVVAIYPGTVYSPSDPIFLPSLGNKFILKRKDYSLIDGNDRFLSRFIFKSCVAREGYDAKDRPFADVSWLKLRERNQANTVLSNPLAIGHYINSTQRESGLGRPNVMYWEYDFENWPNHLHYLIPNIHYTLRDEVNVTKSTLLMALHDIDDGEELFASYMNLVTS